jgi:hypothetical protein
MDLLVRTNQIHQMYTICVDKRFKNADNGMWMVYASDNRPIYLPPPINDMVPAIVLSRKEQCIALIGLQKIKERFGGTGTAGSSPADTTTAVPHEPQASSFSPSILLSDDKFAPVSTVTEGYRIPVMEEPKTTSKEDTNNQNYSKFMESREKDLTITGNPFATSYY